MPEDQTHLQQDIPIEIGGGRSVMESYPEVVKWFNDPDIKNLDPRFTKDIILSNLNPQEVQRLRDIMEFTRELGMYPNLVKAKLHFIATAFDIPIVSNAKGGFARRMSHTQRQEGLFEKKEPEKSGWWNLGRKK